MSLLHIYESVTALWRSFNILRVQVDCKSHWVKWSLRSIKTPQTYALWRPVNIFSPRYSIMSRSCYSLAAYWSYRLLRLFVNCSQEQSCNLCITANATTELLLSGIKYRRRSLLHCFIDIKSGLHAYLWCNRLFVHSDYSQSKRKLLPKLFSRQFSALL